MCFRVPRRQTQPSENVFMNVEYAGVISVSAIRRYQADRCAGNFDRKSAYFCSKILEISSGTSMLFYHQSQMRRAVPTTRFIVLIGNLSRKYAVSVRKKSSSA